VLSYRPTRRAWISLPLRDLIAFLRPSPAYCSNSMDGIFYCIARGLTMYSPDPICEISRRLVIMPGSRSAFRCIVSRNSKAQGLPSKTLPIKVSTLALMMLVGVRSSWGMFAMKSPRTSFQTA